MEDRDDKLPRLPGQLVVIAIATLVLGLISVLSLVIALRLGSLWAILFLPLVIPTALVACAIIVRRFAGRGVSSGPTRAKQA